MVRNHVSLRGEGQPNPTQAHTHIYTHKKKRSSARWDKEYPSIKVNMCRFVRGPRIHTQLSLLLLYRGIEWYKRNRKNKRTKGKDRRTDGQRGQKGGNGKKRGQDEHGTGKGAPGGSLEMIGWMQFIQNDSFFLCEEPPSSPLSICPSGIIISAPCQLMARLSSLSAHCPRLEGPLTVNIGYLCAVSLLLAFVFVLLFGPGRYKPIAMTIEGKQISNPSIVFCCQCNMYECNERRLDVLQGGETTALTFEWMIQSTMRDLISNRIGIATLVDVLLPSIGRLNELHREGSVSWRRDRCLLAFISSYCCCCYFYVQICLLTLH